MVCFEAGFSSSIWTNKGRQRSGRARVIDFDNAPGSNRFLAVRELKLAGFRTPNYNRRADLVCFVNGLPLVFIELKAVHKNIREGFDNNLSDYMDENVIAHAFHHNAFLIVSNGDRARYGSITSEWGHFAEWKRLDEADKGSLDAEVLLNGMLAHDRLLEIVENFILFDDSKPGATRKVIARNHQFMGVNRAVASVSQQEKLKQELPLARRFRRRVVELPLEPRMAAKGQSLPVRAEAISPFIPEGPVAIIERAHPKLGRLGVFWHTQGSGKSYSMAFFAEKVRRKLEGNFTFVLMTDRKDLDDQIYKTFVGCGIANDQTPRATSGADLEKRLAENHRYVFSLIHKFNKDVDSEKPYSERDDIIVISDEAHRTQAGRLARNMRLALPNASFIGFTGTPHLPTGRSHKTHLWRLCIALRLQAIRGGRQHSQTGLRESRGETGSRPNRSERPHHKEDRRRRPRSRPGGASRKAAGSGLRSRYCGRAAREDCKRFR